MKTNGKQTKTSKNAAKKNGKSTSKRNLKSATGKCLCGCGKSVPRRFLQGHDAKLHGDVLDAFKAEKTIRVSKATGEYLNSAPWMTPSIKKAVRIA